MATRWPRLEPYDGQSSRTVLRGRDRCKAALLPGIEGLWDQLKDQVCYNVFASLRALEDAMTDFLRPFWEEPERVRDLIGNGWLRARAEAFFRQLSTSIAV